MLFGMPIVVWIPWWIGLAAFAFCWWFGIVYWGKTLEEDSDPSAK